MARNKKIRFSIYLDYEEYLDYYNGLASRVRLRADNGQIIVFPANRLKPYLTHSGVQGRFEITFDQANKFVSLTRVSH